MQVKNFILLCLFLAIKSMLTAQVAPTKSTGLDQKANNYLASFPQEKVYLHFDRPSYWASDYIWFKAYLRDSPDKENNLNVELINPWGKIIQKRMYWANNGLAYGDLYLPDTVSSGIYQVRAYTNWMRNFDDEYLYKKNIVVWNLSLKKENEVPVATTKDDVDFQFFPEGGNLIANTPNKLAFKAVDKNGNGMKVDGIVYDQAGNEIISFSSIHNGMGSFMIEPLLNTNYTAKINIGDKFKIEKKLPLPLPVGVAMQVSSLPKNEVVVQLNEVGGSGNSNYWLLAQSNGKVVYEEQVTLNQGSSLVRIAKMNLPGGLLQITLFNDKQVPLAERLIFNNTIKYIDLAIKSNKDEYKTREAVVIGIGAFDNINVPCVSNLSISVSHPDTHFNIEDHPDNIVSNFFLTSDIKGKVENPAYYFKDDSMFTRMALDHLLLTQGWRKFEWKSVLENKSPVIEYPHENSIIVKGKVENIVTSKPMKDAKITLMFVKKDFEPGKQLTMKDLAEKFKVYEAKTDDNGKFVFDNMFFYNISEYTVQALNTNSKRNTWIDLDRRSSISPKVTVKPTSYLFRDNKTYTTTTFFSETAKDVIDKKWKLSDTILLADVNIRLTRVQKNDGHTRPYLSADYSVDLEKEEDVFGSVSDYFLFGRVPGVFGEELGSLRVSGSQSPPLLILDGIPTDVDFIKDLPINGIEKIEVLRIANMYGSQGINGAIVFYSKRGFKQKVEAKDSRGMRSSYAVGYSVNKMFYSPNYHEKPAEKVNDFRNTLYWNPVVQTLSDGMATVNFYNSDQSGRVSVIVEGVTAEGIPCRGVATYNVSNY